MNYIVHVRFGGEANWITDFVTPNNPLVTELAQVKPAGAEPVSAFSRWIWQNINYPTGVIPDYHEIRAFTKSSWFTPVAIKLSTPDFFEFPREVLGWKDARGRRFADCEGSSVTLCSLLRNYISPYDVHVALGDMSIFSHAWVRVRRNEEWQIIETTSPHSRLLTEDKPYKMKAYFNDKEAVELEPGFFSNLRVFAEKSRRAYRAKLNVICPFLEQCEVRY